MEEYSIFGSNISNDLLLYLKNNQNNIKIDIHNNSHNFSLNYISSNETITDYITKGLKDIKSLDNDNYIHSKIDNSKNVTILGSYIQENIEDTINSINFINLKNATVLDLSHRNDRTVTSDFIFDKYDGIINTINYKYFSTTQYVIKDISALNNLRFYDQNQQELYVLSGLLMYAKFDNKNAISSYQLLNKENKIFPYNIKIFSISGNFAYEIDERTFDNYSTSKQANKVLNSIITNEIIINIPSVLIAKSFFDTNVNTFRNNIGNLNFNNILGMKIKNKNRNSPEDPLSYNLQLIYNGITLHATNTKVINHYDIDMSNNNIQNVKSLATNQLILNNVIYDDIISSDNVSDKINNILSADNSIQSRIVNGVLSDNYITIENLIELFSSVNVSDALDTHSNYLIPYVEYDNTTDSIHFIYDSNVSTKHILNLKALDNILSDELLKHSNGIIYKSNTLDNLTIDNNLNVYNNITVDGHITINSNTLKWDDNILKFTHSDDVTFQTSIFTFTISFPDVYNSENHDFNFIKEEDNYQFSFTLNGLNCKICHPFNIIGTTSDNIPIIQADYVSQANGNMSNSKLMLLNLIQKYNIYISSRFGNSFNKSQNLIFLYYTPTLYNELTSDTFSENLYYMDNGQSNVYLDYYEFILSDKVLLHQLQFNDIEFSEFKMKLESIHNMNHLDDELLYYIYDGKNYIKYFDIIGYDSDWELIKKVHVTNNIKKPNRLIIVDINAKKRYNKYRITFHYQNESGEYADNSLPYIFTDLTLKYESLHDNNSIDFSGKQINLDVTNTFNINNHIDLTSNTITKLIINEDYKNVEHYFEASKNPYAVCHINYETDNQNLLDNNLLKLGLINKDSKLPDIGPLFNSKKNIYNVYHSLHIVDSNLFYTQSVNNSLDINIDESSEKYLTITSSGVVAINTDKRTLSNIVKTNTEFTGLIINGDLRFNLSNGESLPYIDISINNNLDVLNSYKINLPDNCSDINNNVNYFLKPYDIDNTNKTISTRWDSTTTIFQKGNIYIGSTANSNLFDIHSNFSNIHPNGVTTSENTTHIRKLVIGYPEDIKYDIINSNVLTVGGSVYATHDVSTDSDAAYKYDLQQINNCREKVNTLTGYTFFRNDTTEKRRFCGLIAQDVEKVLPEAIVKKHDDKLRVLYNNLSGLFVECFKELYREIDTLRDEIKDLKKEVYSHKD